MSQTSRTSTNEHADAIHEILECLVTSDGSVYRITDAQADQIESHAAALAQQLADVQEVCRNLSEAEQEYEAERGAMAARIERYDAALRAAASYIDLLDKGKGPSDPAYLPLRDCYRNAVEDLGDAQNDGSNGR